MYKLASWKWRMKIYCVKWVSTPTLLQNLWLKTSLKLYNIATAEYSGKEYWIPHSCGGLHLTISINAISSSCLIVVFKKSFWIRIYIYIYSRICYTDVIHHGSTNASLNSRIGRRNQNQIPPASDSESGSSDQAALEFNPGVGSLPITQHDPLPHRSRARIAIKWRELYDMIIISLYHSHISAVKPGHFELFQLVWWRLYVYKGSRKKCSSTSGQAIMKIED